MAIREPGTGKKTRREMGKQATRIAALEAQLDDRDAEIERLRADLVWSSKRVVRWDGDGFLYHTRERPFSERDSKFIRHDGTADSICRAVRETRNGVS